MSKNRDYNNPKRIFREKGGVEPPEKRRPDESGGVTSIRRSEIISIAPEGMDLSKVYLGRRPAGNEECAGGNPPD
jgi:hypothetical protein